MAQYAGEASEKELVVISNKITEEQCCFVERKSTSNAIFIQIYVMECSQEGKSSGRG